MSPYALLLVYCLAILLASLAGGWLTIRIELTHRRMEMVLSFVSGFMLGVALLHLLPHAIIECAAGASGHAHGGAEGHAHDVETTVGHDLLGAPMLWMMVGFLAMFLLERFFCFHHHDVPGGSGAHDAHELHDACGSHAPGHGGHGHELRWAGAAVGLTVHSVIAGVALAADVAVQQHDGAVRAWAGIGTFLVIVLHKPFDALTIATLMHAGGRSSAARHLANALFSLAIPIGAALFALGAARSAEGGAAAGLGGAPAMTGGALAFSAGTFLCIALSDLLPELQFHRHDRIKLSVALLVGVGLAWAVSQVE